MTVDLRKALGLDSEAEHREENTVSYEIYPASTGAATIKWPCSCRREGMETQQFELFVWS